MTSIRGGSGLGDALYVQAIARHLLVHGAASIEACSAWPDVFRPLNGRCVVSPFRRQNIDRLAHYSLRRMIKATDQFRDCCLQAGIPDDVELRLDWMPENIALIDAVRLESDGRPIVLVQLPRLPMNRNDGYGAELLPDCRVIQRAIDALGDAAFVVQVGKGEPLFEFAGLALDLANATDVSDLIDLAFAAHACLGYVSFMVPLAESLDKPALMVWSRRGLTSRNEVISALTPHKVVHKPVLVRHVIDDCGDVELTGAVHALLEQVRCPALV